MNITPRPGQCFISPDPAEERAGKFGIIFAPTAVIDVKGQTSKPRSMQSIPKTGLCLQHRASLKWYDQGEANLAGKRVVFDRWASRSFKLLHNGKEYEFITCSQWDILAVIE